MLECLAQPLRIHNDAPIRTLAAEISGGDGPLASDDVACYLVDAVIEQDRVIKELRASPGMPARNTRRPQLRAIKGGRQ